MTAAAEAIADYNRRIARDPAAALDQAAWLHQAFQEAGITFAGTPMRSFLRPHLVDRAGWEELQSAGGALLRLAAGVARRVFDGDAGRLCAHLGIQSQAGGHGGGTTADGEYTVRYAECLAACDKAPAVQVNLRYHGPVRAEDVDRFLQHTQAFNLEEPVPPVPGQSGPAGMAVEPAGPTAKESSR